MAGCIKKTFTTVVAALTALIFIGTGCDKTDKFLNVERTYLELSADPQDESMTVESSSVWMAYSRAEWLVAYKDGEGNLRLVINGTNESLSDREGEIDVLNGDANVVTVTVLQKALDAEITVLPARLDFDGKGGTQTLTVTIRNLSEWEYENLEKEWLEVTQDENDEYNLIVTAEYSDSLYPRKDTVVVSANYLDGFEPVKIPVEQAGVNLLITDGGQAISSDIEIGPEAQDVELTIVSLYSWTLTADSNDVMLSLTESDGDPDAGIDIAAGIPANEGTEPITYTLTFVCGGETYEARIVQAANQ